MLYPNVLPLSQRIIFLLPAEMHFSTTFLISGAERNCGFLNWIIEFVFAAAETRSVCLAKKAGIWTTSQTSLTGFA